MARDASVHGRKGSPYWYCTYYCVRRMKRVQEATPWRVDDSTGRRRAQAFAAAKSSEAGAFRGHAKREVWPAWVPGFLQERYRASPLSHTRMINAWEWLQVWLDDIAVHAPLGLTYYHVIGYVAWRLGHKRTCGKPYSRNTAVFEVKALGLLLQEAVRRDFCPKNVCDRMGLRRDPARKKPELSDEEIALIRAECARREGHLPIGEQWLTTSFEIALHTWCRLSSTAVPMHLVDFARGEIMLRVKGRKIGEQRWHVVPIHPDLRPRLEALRAAGAAQTCILPPMPALEWWRLRQKLGIGHTCFHSTRVTGITRGWRAGVPESFAMRIAGHKSAEVHRIYQRETTADLAGQLEKVRYQPAPDDGRQTPEGRP